MPALWAFFCLGQILPISFIQNLFYLALLRQPRSESETSRPTLSSATQRTFSQPWVWHTCALCFAACLALARWIGQGQRLIVVILAARLLLFAPLFIPLTDGDRGATGSLQWTLSLYHIGPQLGYLVQACIQHGVGGVLRAVHSHPAVSALGYDLVISVFSSIAWMYFGPTGNPQEILHTKSG